jgi:plastocyanin
MTRSVLFLLPFAWLAASAAARADDVFRQDIELKDHVFAPSEITVPAGKPIEFHIKNLDATAEEFDSSALKVEKVIPAKGEGVVHIHPLAPGRYKFEGEYHEKTAHGVVIAR